MPDSISIGLLGAGRIGKVHAAAIAATPRIHLTAVADTFAEPAAELAAAHGAEVRTIDEIMASDDIDAVFITTPTDVHADLIEQAAAPARRSSARSRSISTCSASATASPWSPRRARS